MLRSPLLLAALVLAGCGSDKPPASVSDVVDQAMHEQAGHCSTLLTARFVREVYGDVKACRAMGGDKAGAQLPEARASDLRLAGDAASVRITRPSGESGVLRLRREAGRWKLDRYDDDLVRAVFLGSVVDQLERAASKPGLDVASAKDCIDDRAHELGPARLRAFGYGLLNNRDDARKTFSDMVARCLADPRTGPDNQSYFRFYLVQEIVAAAREQGYDDEAISCVRRELRDISDADVLEHATRDKSAPPPATERIAAVVASCQ